MNEIRKSFSDKEFLEVDCSLSVAQPEMKKVTLNTPVEDIVREHPQAVGFLTRRGVRCIRCGEPLWCSLGELFLEDKVAEPDTLLAELNEFLAGT